jgi:urease accessory protein UreF
MTKIVSKMVRCAVTGQITTVNTLVHIQTPQEARLAEIQAANEETLDAQAEREADSMRKHKAIRPDKQKIGW